MAINPNIFKAYDIRGKVPAELNEKTAEAIGAAATIFFLRKRRKKTVTILIARDVRVSSLPLTNALIRGITSRGGKIIDAGEGTTPYFTWLTHTIRHDGGIMVTASHNPAEYNGFKIKDAQGNGIGLASGLGEIRRLATAATRAGRATVNIENTRSETIISQRAFSKTGPWADISALPEYYRAKYLNTLTKGIAIENIKAVIDAAGGSTTLFLPQLLNRFSSFIYKPLFFDRDGTFRSHSPNPLIPESQRHIKKALAGGSCQFGAIFDGDGDRVLFFDERGNAVRSEYILALLAEAELKKNKKSSFVLTANCSRAIKNYLREKGVSVIESRVGYVFVHDSMQRARAALGVEISGHFYFKDFFYGDSALLALLKLAEVVSKSHAPLSRLIEAFDKTHWSGEINLRVKNAKSILKKFEKYYKKSGARISKLDGLTVEFPDWWANIRPSNTEPVVRFVAEADTPNLLREKQHEIESMLKNA